MHSIDRDSLPPPGIGAKSDSACGETTPALGRNRRGSRPDRGGDSRATEEAEVDAAEIERLEPAMTDDPKDRHVLAAAVAADSELIVTFDLDDFPVQACEPLGVEAIHPDDFLLDLHDLDPKAVRAALDQQAGDLNSP